MESEPIAHRWISAFNRHHIADLIGLYTENATHTSPKLRAMRPETKGRIVGRVALATWWHDAFERLPTLHYELKYATTSKNRVLIEYERQVQDEASMMVAEAFELENDRICSSTVYHG